MAEDERAHTFLFADLAGFTALTEAVGRKDTALAIVDWLHRVTSAGTFGPRGASDGV